MKLILAKVLAKTRENQFKDSGYKLKPLAKVKLDKELPK